MVGVPHDELGEEVAAVVALKPAHAVTAEELADVRQGAGRGVQVPAAVWLIDELPKGPTGKILKRE